LSQSSRTDQQQPSAYPAQGPMCLFQFLCVWQLVGLAAGFGDIDSCSGEEDHDKSECDLTSHLQTPSAKRASILPHPHPRPDEKKQVLLIIDMQSDYDLTYNMKNYNKKKNLWSNQMLSASHHIESLINACVDWDLIVFSQDWLIPVLTEQNASHQFCLEFTPGAGPLQNLLDAADKKTKNQLRYTKNVDDAFNELETNEVLDKCLQEKPPCSVPAHYPNRGYDNNNTYGGKTLVNVLADRGYMPENTKITVAGTEADMCVLTSALKALTYGFEVDVFEPGLNGGWSGPQDWCSIPFPGGEVPLPENWKELVYKCQGAAGRKQAIDYMTEGGAQILWQLPNCSHDVAQKTYG